MLWNVPNILSLIRAIIGPICIICITRFGENGLLAALILIILAEITDYLDGKIARSFNQVTDIGKLIDPMSDSLYRISVFVAFFANGWMPIWMFMIILMRDLAVSYLRIMAEQTGLTLSARQSGKWKAVAQSMAQIGVTALLLLEIYNFLPSVDGLVYALLFFATAVTAYSLADYAHSVISLLKSDQSKS